jgi:hypothetical protein
LNKNRCIKAPKDKDNKRREKTGGERREKRKEKARKEEREKRKDKKREKRKLLPIAKNNRLTPSSKRPILPFTYYLLPITYYL